MKRVFAILLIVVLGVFIFSTLYSSNGRYNFSKFGESTLNGKVSEKFVNKNVNGEDKEVKFGAEELETGSANVVTSVVVNYRAFDTLGEVTVLFLSALGVSVVLGGYKNRLKFKVEPNFILKIGSKVAVAIILITGFYIFIHGHLTPGGGFPGGAMIGSAVLLMFISNDEFRVKVKSFSVLEGLSGSLFIILGLIGLSAGGYFLYNYMPMGKLGSLFSAGLIPVIYVLIGLKVGSELSSLISHFAREGEDK